MKYLLFFFLTLSLPSLAINSFNVPAPSEEMISALAEQSFWKALLRYKKDNEGNIRSEVTSKAYFLSKQGETDSRSELQTTLDVLFSGTLNNVHPSCRFPARFTWLSRQLNLDSKHINLSHCDDFNQWAKLPQLDSASLVYASGYLGNPASFFGHLLLKFNYRTNETGQNALLDHSINFGAAIPPEDSAITYVFKGFFGGYFAAFKEDSFFRHHNMYAEQESRDLWDYKLNLTDEQLDMLIMHVWELREQKFDYYYLNDNCASRVAELISIITDQTLINDDFYWAQPINVFKAVASSEHKLLKSLDKHQSKYSTFLANYQNLTSMELNAVLMLNEERRTKKALPNNVDAYASLSESEKTNVINTLMAFNDYKDKQKNGNSQFGKKLLKERFLLPAGGNFKPNQVETPPHLGQHPSLTQVTLSQIGDTIATKIRMRATYYDLLSNDTGRLANSSLQMGDIELLVSEQGVRLERFDITNILTLQPAQTKLKETSNLAWKIRLGIESNPQRCFECLVATTELGLGKAYNLGHGAVYVLPELKLQTSTSYLKHASASLTMGYLWDISDYWKSHFEFNQAFIGIADSGLKEDYTISWQNRFGLGIDYDFRLAMERNPLEQKIDFSYSYYWQ
jgi:hypothetical protein